MNKIKRAILEYGSWVMLAIVALSFVWTVIFGIVDVLELSKARSLGIFSPNIFKILEVFKETIVGAAILILSFIPAILLTGFHQILEQKEFEMFYNSYMDDDFDFDDDDFCDDCDTCIHKDDCDDFDGDEEEDTDED